MPKQRKPRGKGAGRPPKVQVEEYVVEKIVAKRYIHGVSEYYVKWEGFPLSENTWEPEENLGRCKNLVVEYEEALRAGAAANGRRTSASVAEASFTNLDGPSDKGYEDDDLQFLESIISPAEIVQQKIATYKDDTPPRIAAETANGRSAHSPTPPRIEKTPKKKATIIYDSDSEDDHDYRPAPSSRRDDEYRPPKPGPKSRRNDEYRPAKPGPKSRRDDEYRPAKPGPKSRLDEEYRQPRGGQSARLEENCRPARAVHNARLDEDTGEVFYMVEWEDGDECEEIPGKVARKLYPQLLIEYLSDCFENSRKIYARRGFGASSHFN